MSVFRGFTSPFQIVGGVGRCIGETRCIQNYTEKADNLYVRFKLISWWCYGGAIVISGTISSTTAAPPVAWAIRKIKLKIKDEIKILCITV